ncbi:MAG: 16S rRNA (uracil(1498)-N(3))-methyltransferase [Bacteroidetes bacterium]|nr:16S rRNA (uracil(1498)-N(3))-methyltransferase [Bacteroidota bacterium]
MQIFYAPGINGDSYMLDEKESKHCIRVLRMVKGTSVKLIDGRGNLYEGHVSDPDPKRCLITVSEVRNNFENRDYRLHIAISPLKNPERFEWFVEKSVEIGIDEITPLICKNTEKQSVKQERTENIIISAMKQSLKALKPVLNEPMSFEKFIGQPSAEKKMIAHCRNSVERAKISDIYRKGDNAVILIGPEGDFSEEEILNASKNGFLPVHLGSSRLRTETAGVSACHSIYFINQ